MRNFAAALLLAQGVPMILMGDEYGHTKDGNNNTYCHDSRWNHLDWKAAHRDTDGLRRFWKHLIHFRRARPELGQANYLGGDVRLPNTHCTPSFKFRVALGKAHVRFHHPVSASGRGLIDRQGSDLASNCVVSVCSASRMIRSCGGCAGAVAWHTA